MAGPPPSRPLPGHPAAPAALAPLRRAGVNISGLPKNCLDSPSYSPSNPPFYKTPLAFTVAQMETAGSLMGPYGPSLCGRYEPVRGVAVQKKKTIWYVPFFEVHHLNWFEA